MASRPDPPSVGNAQSNQKEDSSSVVNPGIPPNAMSLLNGQLRTAVSTLPVQRSTANALISSLLGQQRNRVAQGLQHGRPSIPSQGANAGLTLGVLQQQQEQRRAVAALPPLRQHQPPAPAFDLQAYVAAAATTLPHDTAPVNNGKRQREQATEVVVVDGAPRKASADFPHLASRERERGAWDDRYGQLQVYKANTGNANPPQTKGSPADAYKLACWLNGQRQKFRKGTLDADRFEKLAALGCDGFGEDQRGTDVQERPVKRKKVSWEIRFMELREYKTKFGHANPHYGKATPEACQHLAQWLSNQRSDFRASKKITVEQVQLLRNLGCRGFGEADDI